MWQDSHIRKSFLWVRQCSQNHLYTNFWWLLEVQDTVRPVREAQHWVSLLNPSLYPCHQPIWTVEAVTVYTQHYRNKRHHILKGNQNMSYTGNEFPREQDLRNTQQHHLLTQSWLPSELSNASFICGPHEVRCQADFMKPRHIVITAPLQHGGVIMPFNPKHQIV